MPDHGHTDHWMEKRRLIESVSQNEGIGTTACWIREGKGETETVNQLDKDGFIKLTEGEQMKIPFD